MKKIFVFVAVAMFCASCKEYAKPQFEQTMAIDPTAVDHPKFEAMVESIEYIPLQTTDLSLVGEIVGLVEAEGRFYINSDRKNVLCFSSNGEFLFKVGNTGRGPGEYISPFSISVDGGVVYVACQESGNLLCYDAANGKFLQSLKLPKHYIQVVVGGGYIYGMDMTTKPFAIDAMPLENPAQPTELYATASGEYVYSSFTQMFKSGDDGCYWVDPLRGRVYELAGGEMTPFIDFDFGEYEYSDNILRAGNYRNDNTMVFDINNFYRVGDIAVLSFSGGDRDSHTLILDLHSGKRINLGYMSYRGEPAPTAYYKKAPSGFLAAGERFYRVCSSLYFDECGDLPTEYASYARMKGLNPLEDNPTIVAYKLKLQ